MPRIGSQPGRKQGAGKQKVKVRARGKPTRTVELSAKRADAYRTRVKGKERNTAAQTENAARHGQLTTGRAKEIRTTQRRIGRVVKKRDERQLRSGATRTQTARQRQEEGDPRSRMPPGAIPAGRKGAVDQPKTKGRGAVADLKDAAGGFNRARKRAGRAVDRAIGGLGENAKRELEDAVRGLPASAQQLSETAAGSALQVARSVSGAAKVAGGDSAVGVGRERKATEPGIVKKARRGRKEIAEGIKADPAVKVGSAAVKAAKGDSEGAKRDLKEAAQEAWRRPLSTLATGAAGVGVVGKGISYAERGVTGKTVAEQTARPKAKVRERPDTRDNREVRRQARQERRQAARKAKEGTHVPERRYSANAVVRGGQKAVEEAKAALGKDPHAISKAKARRKANRRFDVDQRVAQAAGLMDEDRTARAHRKERRKLKTRERRVLADLHVTETVRKGTEKRDLEAAAKHHRAQGDHEAADLLQRLADEGHTIDPTIEKVTAARKARIRERDAAQRARGALHENTEFIERGTGAMARGEVVKAGTAARASAGRGRTSSTGSSTGSSTSSAPRARARRVSAESAKADAPRAKAAEMAHADERRTRSDVGNAAEDAWVEQKLADLDLTPEQPHLTRKTGESRSDFEKRQREARNRAAVALHAAAERELRGEYRKLHGTVEARKPASRREAGPVEDAGSTARREPHAGREARTTPEARDAEAVRALKRTQEAADSGDTAKIISAERELHRVAAKLEHGHPVRRLVEARKELGSVWAEQRAARHDGNVEKIADLDEAEALARKKVKAAEDEVATLRPRQQPVQPKRRTSVVPQSRPQHSSRARIPEGDAARRAMEDRAGGRQPGESRAGDRQAAAGKDSAYEASRAPGEARRRRAARAEDKQIEDERRFDPVPKTPKQEAERIGRRVEADAERLGERAREDPAGTMADIVDREIAGPESPYEWAENPYGHPVGSPVTLEQLREITDDPAFLRRPKQHDERDVDPRTIEAGHGYDPKQALGVDPEGQGTLRSELYVGRRLTMRALGDALRRDFAVRVPGHDTPDLPLDVARREAQRRGPEFVVRETDRGRALVVPKAINERWDKHFADKTMTERMFQTVSRQYVRTVLPFSVMWHAGNVADLMIRTALIADQYALNPVANKAFRNGLEARLAELDPRLRDEVLGSLQGHAGSRETIHRPAWADLDRDAHTVLGKALHAIDAVRGHKVAGAIPRGYTRAVDASLGGTAAIERAVVEAMSGSIGRRMAKEMGIAARDHVELGRKLADEFARSPEALHEFHRRTLEINGDYLTMGPTGRKLTQGPVPFLNWLREANKFVFLTLPKRSPIRTAMIFQAARLTQQQRAELGLNYYLTDEEARALHLPPPARGFLGGALALGGGSYFPMSPLSSFGQAAGTAGALRGSASDWQEHAGQVFPFLTRGVIKAAVEHDPSKIHEGVAASLVPGFKQYKAATSKLGLPDSQKDKRTPLRRAARAVVAPLPTRDFSRGTRGEERPKIGDNDYLQWQDWQETADQAKVSQMDPKLLREWVREHRKRHGRHLQRPR